MPRFFVCADQISDGIVTVLGEDAHHISRSLRMAVQERILVCDQQKNEYVCELTEFLTDRVKARVLEMRTCSAESPMDITVFQALPKGDKLDSVIQKSVECGASRVIPFESERCIVRSKSETEPKKTERRLRIAAEAAKQCGRGILPQVHPTLSFSKALESACAADLALFCYEGEETLPLPAVLKTWRSARLPADAIPETVSIMIGSEGGFSVAEKELAVQKGMLSVGLGKRILRTETAASFVLACLVYEFELASK